MSDDELSKLRDEVLRERFCELLWEACGSTRRYVAYLEALAESRVPIDAMRYHIRAARAASEPAPPAEPRAETEIERAERLRRQRLAVIEGVDYGP